MTGLLLGLVIGFAGGTFFGPLLVKLAKAALSGKK